MSEYLKITNGRVIDPANGIDTTKDLFVAHGKIVECFESDDYQTIDAQGLVVAPGMVDIHTHLREPGQTHQETIKTGTMAAAAGGFTSVVTMPGTDPIADNAGTIQFTKDAVARDACVHVFHAGCLTQGRAGEELAPIGSLKQAGVVAVTDSGKCVQSNELMRRALEYAKMFDLPVLDHCQVNSMTQDAVMHEGEVSLQLGLRGWPSAAEDIMVSRNVILADYTKAHVHLQHISSASAVDIIRRAKERGVPVSAEVSPHHLSLTDQALLNFDTNFKVNPPLRSEEDRQALIQGVIDGTLDMIATDHSPHTDYEKSVELDHAPFGVIGLETALPVCLETLYHSNSMELSEVIAKLTHKPSELMKLNKGTLSIGADADIMIFDPEASWTVGDQPFASRSSNSPWMGQKLRGQVKQTIVSGKVVFEHA